MQEHNTIMDKHPEIFDEIRPYNDAETRQALQRMIREPLFFRVMKYFFPDKSKEDIIQKIAGIKTVMDWQVGFMHPIINSIIKNTSDGLTWSGFDRLEPGKSYLFISNHRDILLDSAILQVLLYDNGLDTSQITFGNNLMETQFITDAGKINKMFTVVRETCGRGFYRNSSVLSAYIRSTILDNQSIWIAQRNGRTKDGDDKTYPGLLKMLNISGKGEFQDNLAELNIVPMTVSYEFEPCALSKIREMYIAQTSEYIKKRGEDVESIVNGILQYKGHIHLALSKPLDAMQLNIRKNASDNEKTKILTSVIDKEIHRNFKLWPTNYAAADILHKKDDFRQNYSDKQKEKFIDHVEKITAEIEGDKKTIRKQVLIMYANPVRNFLKCDFNN